MKIRQKIKYIAIGAIAMTVAIPVIIKATDAVPITFSQGDILSAEVLNNIFTRINQATSPLTADDLLGTWTIVQYMPYNGQPGNGSCRINSSCTITGTTDSADQLTRYRTGTATFSQNGSTYSFTTTGIAALAVGTGTYSENGSYAVIAETVVFKEGVQQSFFVGSKKSATSVVLKDMQPGSNSFNLIMMAKQSQPPTPPTTLSATVTGTAVTLTWVDQSTDETGFKVQTKTAVSGTWTLVGSATAAGVQTLTATASAGKNWYRVLATNANGDSITSNEILVEVQ